MGGCKIMNSPLRELIYLAKSKGIEIDEITVSPSYYKTLEAEALYSCHYDAIGSTVLQFYNTVINKRPCKGCCEHGSSNS